VLSLDWLARSASINLINIFQFNQMIMRSLENRNEKMSGYSESVHVSFWKTNVMSFNVFLLSIWTLECESYLYLGCVMAYMIGLWIADALAITAGTECMYGVNMSACLRETGEMLDKTHLFDKGRSGCVFYYRICVEKQDWHTQTAT